MLHLADHLPPGMDPRPRVDQLTAFAGWWQVHQDGTQMTQAYYDLLYSYVVQGRLTLGVFAASAVVLLVSWLMYRVPFMRRYVFPVWIAYLLAMYAGTMLYGVYGQ
jgi:hypothetical protein